MSKRVVEYGNPWLERWNPFGVRALLPKTVQAKCLVWLLAVAWYIKSQLEQ